MFPAGIIIDTDGEVGREVAAKLDADIAKHVLPPKTPADLDRFWTDVERACKDRDDSVSDVIFDSFYVGGLYPGE